MQGGRSHRSSQGAVLMVRPKHFGFNAETAATNRFPAAGRLGAHRGTGAALEFDAFAAALAAEGVTVCVARDSDEPRKPDAVFPNNWVSFHADGTVVLYPMQAASRRARAPQRSHRCAWCATPASRFAAPSI